MSTLLLAAVDLNTRIRNFASLVGLVLVLVTLFTNQRQAALTALPGSSPSSSAPFTREVLLDLLLAVVTALLFLTGLPLVIDAAQSFHPRAEEGQLRIAFMIVWLLLIPLVVWQIVLVVEAVKKRRTWRKQHPKKPKERPA